MTDDIDFKKIAQEAVEEAVDELKGEADIDKINKIVETIDAVNMTAEIVQDTLKDIELKPEEVGEEGIKKIAKSSAKAAILEGLKS
ncbi:hypothetical protein KAR26_01175 [Candidatus Parcubacteria bacterium]|nr:hypothetical protein [Candidatus Parcubacteria bacterium]